MVNQHESSDCERREDLPRFGDLVNRFSLFSTFPKCSPQIGRGGSIDCDCNGCKEWHAFLEGASPYSTTPQYEVFTLEHVRGLAEYLLLRSCFYRLPVMNVLEVGAGSGKLCNNLSFHLSQIRAEGRVVNVTATDNGERGLSGPGVAKQDAVHAISAGLPDVVLVSWMPIGVDWTAHMRATPSVVEYILIGEADFGICGHPWLTWGYTDTEDADDSSSEEQLSPSDSFPNSHALCNCTEIISPFPETAGFDPLKRHSSWSANRSDEALVGSEGGRRATMSVFPLDSLRQIEARTQRGQSSSSRPTARLTVDSRQAAMQEVPPYRADGWFRVELPALSSFQICRTDERWSTRQHSRTVSFRRDYSNESQP